MDTLTKEVQELFDSDLERQTAIIILTIHTPKDFREYNRSDDKE